MVEYGQAEGNACAKTEASVSTLPVLFMWNVAIALQSFAIAIICCLSVVGNASVL